MNYRYLLEETANKNVCFDDVVNENGVGILNILCYNVVDQYKYPFLQFMMDKVPYCNGVVKEQITLPYIFLRNKSSNIGETVLQKVRIGLELIGCDYDKVVEEMYKGVIFGSDGKTLYALVNITGIDICGLNFMRQTTCWFVLPSEIINTKKVCNIDVDNDVTEFFTNVPKLGILFNSKTNVPYIIPDAVYTGGETKNAEFNSVFGNIKKKIYDSCGEYYFFYRSFCDAVKDGGWLSNNGDKYVTGAINRYALFVEGKIYIEMKREFSLIDDVIECKYPEPCITICYSAEHEIKPDILVKNYESFVCLSYHKLNKKLLDESFLEKNKKTYMIE